jgi:muramoyltetrapeptide carboxypeptidase
MERGIDALRSIGLEPVLSTNALERDGYRAGSPNLRAHDINLGFSDPSVRGIICSVGGWNAISLLSLIDYQQIRLQPKVFVGFSDITTLHSAIQAKASMVTFHGPTLLPSLGELGQTLNLTKHSFVRAVFDPHPIGQLKDPGCSSDEFRFWDRDDLTPRTLLPHNGVQTIVGGRASGRLLGGNLTSIVGLLGTDYFPDPTDAILLLEEEGGATPATERYLCCLAIHGVLEKVSGLIFGRPCRYNEVSPERNLSDLLREVGDKYNIPVLLNVMSSHCDPILTVPLGVNCEMDADKGEIHILEGGVY